MKTTRLLLLGLIVFSGCQANKEEWTALIVDNLGEVTLNGVLVNSFPLSGPGWEAMLQDSKFNDSESEASAYLGDARWHDFGRFSKGHLCFQDHPGRVSFRNVFIKEIP